MLHKILAAIFVLFAAFQYNDPDFYIWIPIYLIVGLIAILYDRGKYHLRLTQFTLAAYILGMISYYPDVISWIENGTPSIANSMQAESSFIEFIREFFGLGICVFALGYYCFLISKKEKI
jgi:hypothetical protein